MEERFTPPADSKEEVVKREWGEKTQCMGREDTARGVLSQQQSMAGKACSPRRHIAPSFHPIKGLPASRSHLAINGTLCSRAQENLSAKMHQLC